jgi:hypothetical protein
MPPDPGTEPALAAATPVLPPRPVPAAAAGHPPVGTPAGCQRDADKLPRRGLVAAARMAAADWDAYAGAPGRAGHRDDRTMARSMRRLRAALSRISRPDHAVELRTGQHNGRAARLLYAVESASRGQVTAVTVDGRRVAIIIPGETS